MDIYRYDDSFRDEGFAVIAGIDEAGRGPLAGPVVAAAVILPPHIRIHGLRDSKKVPEKERTRLFWEVLVSADAVGVGIVDNLEIDRTNILRATKSAMKQAVDDLSWSPDALLVDAVTIPGIAFRQFPIIKGDAKSASVAAASIIAKYVRDTLMLHYDSLYPDYNFRRHKGYCTKDHMKMIALLGPCPIHRKSFRQVMTTGLPFALS
ncbi:MAG: ribonuclease HII [Nitrospirota bacterium]|nr:ribonuclease HII [Nitrospirota bacterium]